MNLYNIRRGPHGFQLAKFDDDFNVLAVYDVDPKYCSCPAGPRPTCRHRKMLPRMLAKVNTDEFYCYETNTWHQPLGDLLRPEARDPEGREALPDANMTAEEIESLPDGVEKDFHHEMQIAGEAVPQGEIELASPTMPEAELSGVAVEAQQAPAVRSAAPSIRRR